MSKRNAFVAVVCLVAALSCLVAQSTHAQSRTRADAIALYQSQYSSAPEELVMAPQTAVTSSSDVRFSIAGAAVGVTQPSWIVYVDTDPTQGFEHPTEVYLVPVDAMENTIELHEGDSWLVIDGAPLYEDFCDMAVSADYVSGSLAQDAVYDCGWSSPPAVPLAANQNVCALIVSGSNEKRHHVMNPHWIKEAHPNIQWQELGTQIGETSNDVPTFAQLLAKLDEFSDDNCDKFYFVFTGHATFSGTMVLNHEKNAPANQVTGSKKQYLTGSTLGAALQRVKAKEYCVILNCCFAEKVAKDMVGRMSRSGLHVSALAATQENKTATAERGAYTHFVYFYNDCKLNPVEGQSLLGCINQRMSDYSDANPQYKPKCYPEKVRSTSPQVAVEVKSDVPQRAKKNFRNLPGGTDYWFEGSVSRLDARLQNHPNPFNPTTSISFDIHAAGTVLLSIHGVDGGLVKSIAREWMPVGTYTYLWDGRDDSGREVASGMYWCRLVSVDGVATRKMVLLK